MSTPPSQLVDTGSRRRMTRPQRQAQTRARLIQAAAEVFAEKGFHGATVEEITERAGYTRGAYYSNFDDKDDLFLALIDERLARAMTEIGAVLEGASGPEEVVASLRQVAADRQPDERWAMLHAEFWLYAMRNPALRPRLAERQRAERDAYAQAIQAQFEAMRLPLPAPLDLLAVIVQTLDYGILREQRIDPETVPESAFYDALAVLFEAAVAMAEQQRVTNS